MALEKEIIIANEALKDLSDAQIEAIRTLSQNSEDELFRVKMGDHYRRLDASIEEHSGVARNGDEKTYDYLPRAIDAVKASYDAQISSLTAERDTYKAKASEGGDAVIKAQLESVQAELQTTKDQFNALKAEKDGLDERHKGEILAYRIDNEIARAKEGIKVKAGLNDVAVNTLIAQAIANIKAKNPSFETKGGEERLIFHDENGAPLNNAENQLNPFTAKELLIKELSAMDILEKPKAKGTGTSPDPNGNPSMAAATQKEATDIINKELASKGLIKGTSEFQVEFNKAWIERKIADLPLR